MAEGGDSSDPSVPELAQNEASISDTITELLRHPQLGSLDPSLSFLDDPTALLESALSTDNPILMGTVAGTIDPSALIDPPLNNSAASTATNEAGTLPISQPNVLNPPLHVPDISHLTSVAATSSAEVSGAQQSTTAATSGFLNPPLNVPDISHLTASLVPLAVAAALRGTLPSASRADGETRPASGAMESAPEVSGPGEPPPVTALDADQIRDGKEQNESAATSAGDSRIPDVAQFTPTSSTAVTASNILEPTLKRVLEAASPQLAGATIPVSPAVMASASSLPLTDQAASSSSPSLVHPSSTSSSTQAAVQSTGTQATVGPASNHASVQVGSDSTGVASAAPSSQSAPPPAPPPATLPATSTGIDTTRSQVLTGISSLPAALPTSIPLPFPILPLLPATSTTVRPPITPKGLNLPLLQFLQLNFPNLRIDNLKDILQVNSLLSHALQHQQLQIAAATSASATPPSTFPSIPSAVGTATPVSVAKTAAKVTETIKAKLASVPIGPVKPAVPAGQFIPIEKVAKSGTSSISVGSQISVTKSLTSVGTSTNAASSRAPVFVQIIRPGSNTSTSTGTQATPPAVTRPQPKAKPIVIPRTSGSRLPLLSSTSTTPNILARQPRLPGLVVQTTLASVPSTIPTASPIGVTVTPPSRKELPLRVSTRPSRKPKYLELSKTSAELSRTVIKPAESELMDVDVGQPVQRLEYPAHLKDHTYCIYNPAEGENIARLIAQNFHVACTIPPARLSYAPQVPDSPTTLHKLLKVVPRKAASRGSAASTPRSGSRGSTPRARYSGRSKGNRTRPAGKASARKPDSRAGSEESHSSSSGGSDGEDDGRRRSQRNVGQRKRYVDDLNLALSDEEVMGEVMTSPTKTKKSYKGYGEEEEREWYDEDGSNGRSGKHKSRTISVNPTEGFRYSDVYFEPPPEEAHLVERILAQRQKVVEGSEGKIDVEYFVKYKNYSYLHTEWASYKKLLVGDKRFDGKHKRFKHKQESQGIFANVDDEPFNPEYTVVDRILDVASQKEPNGEIITHYLVKWRSLPYEDATWELEEDVDPEKIRQFNLMQMVPPADELAFVPRPRPSAFKPIKESPQYNEGCQLRPYQLEGLNWLLFNWYTRQNCILADEMGLGKTVQSIALIMAVFNAGIRGPFLVIAPLSTISNWQREFESWCDLNVVIYHGSAYSRRLIHEYELYYRDIHGRIIPDHFKFNVIVTTYEVMLSDDSELQNVEWRLVIIDEAHRLKNRNCKLLEGLRTLDMEHRVLLTGTPLQNSVDELFSLLNFLEPSTFPSHLAFLQQFGDLRTEEQVEELKAILKPMMLRRLKEDVEKSIAPKEETIVEVELTVIQKQYYRAILERNFTFLTTKGAAATVPSLLNVMMELRKCCNHPFLIKGAEPKIVHDFQAQHPAQPVYNALVQASGKLVLIDKLLPKLKESGHKVLIFSQMVRCLDILEDYLRIKGYFYERIDGQVRGILRQAAIDRFSKPDSDRFVFLLCTRAGGLGINLTAADTVIIYDSDWNPQNDIQAQARCHRIGQNKSVKVYRLITRNSYEREMFDRASLKLGLDKAVLQAFQSGNPQSGSGPPQLSKKEIEDLLRKGAYGAIMEEDDDANKFCEEDIDQILERRAHVIQLESEANSTFAKASFVADGSSDLSIDDPDFWQKWAERAKLDLEQLANKDSLVLDTPRQRRQVRRYGNESLEEIVDMTETIEEVMDILPSRGRWGWTRLECFKVEKWLLTFGWGQWRDMCRAASFKKRALGVKDIENISRTMLVYCLAHFKGDEKVPPYIHRLIDPSEHTEPTQEAGNRRDGFFGFTEDDYLALLTKNPETLFQDESYMKHLRRHATKILLRMRQLHITRWNMLAPFLPKIMKGVPAKSLGLVLPRPEEPPPTAWWSAECDHSLLVGIVKHGYERFGLMRSDPALCFRAMVGEEPVQPKKSKKGKTPVKGEEPDEEEEEEELSGMESEGEGEGESGPSTPSAMPFGRKTRSHGTNTPLKPGQYRWPSLADVNTRARRMVSAWLKQQRKEELKVTQLQKEREKKEREAEASRKKEQKRAELAQKWSKREEQDFARVISFFGVDFNSKTNRYLWAKFRQLANLTKKSDERLTLYLHDFKQMCWRMLKKKRVKRGLSGMRVETMTEERASRCLQRIDLLSAVREEILPHPEFDQLIRLCELSFEVPTWWIPVDHDRDLLRGVAKHGLYRSDQLIYNDTELSFKETVPQTALFDPNTNQAVEEEEEEEEEDSGSGSDGEPEGHKLRSSGPTASNPVPLGWPKEKAIVIRMTRIVYAFRHAKWPKPMEGLDLFTPVVMLDSSSESSDSEWGGSEGGSDSDYEAHVGGKRPEKGSKGLKVYISRRAAVERSGSPVVDVEGDVSEKDFEIEKHHGLKLTLKKSSHQTTKSQWSRQEETLKLEIKIPLVQLQFASKAGLKRIPKKRPAENRGDSPDAKRHKKQGSPSTSSSKGIVIVDPAKINFTDLSGKERVGVINRNTKERLSLKQSPTLKTLQMWLQGHPHYNVDPSWGQLVLEWGALKPDLYSRILPAEGSLDVTSVPEYEPVSD